MTARERVVKALNHEETDRLPVDFGATSATGINVSTLYQLYGALGLPERRPVISDVMQLLSVLDEDVRAAMCTDVIPLPAPKTKVGTPVTGRYQNFDLPDGTPCLLDETVKYSVAPNGTCLLYPQGDTSAPPSMEMVAGSGYFHCPDRIEPDEESETPREDFADFNPAWDDATARHYERLSHALYENTNYAIACSFGQGGFGDLAKVPGPTVKYPRGIRTVESFVMAHMLRPDYIHEVFDMQCEAALRNLEILRQAVGDRIQIICMGGTDFGAQNGPYYAPEIYRALYKPYITKLNNYVHKHTNWKTFWHSCGSVVELIDDFIESGVDIANPVQCSAEGMNPVFLKKAFGDRIVFWGGGVDTQKVLPFGTPDEVRAQVRERIEIFRSGGGFVFSSIHNLVAGIPPENIAAMLDIVREYRK